MKVNIDGVWKDDMGTSSGSFPIVDITSFSARSYICYFNMAAYQVGDIIYYYQPSMNDTNNYFGKVVITQTLINQGTFSLSHLPNSGNVNHILAIIIRPKN